MGFNIGDWVEALDDNVSGRITAIQGEDITIEDADGFPLEYQLKDLIKVDAKNAMTQISNADISIAKQQKSEPKRSPSFSPTKRRKEGYTFTVDLHIDKLVDSTKGMTNFEMLNLQLDTATRQLEFAINKRMPKLVFIHGVGEGVLKMELHTLLRRYENLTFYDADYKIFGLGATEVRLFQKGF